MKHKYGIVFSSSTGNTKKLAESLKDMLQGQCDYYDEIPETISSYSILFVGVGINKGTCSVPLQEFLARLHHQKIILFGTCGFSNDPSYHELLVNHVKQNIASDNCVLDYFLCQGEIPSSFKEKYQKLLQEHPDDEQAKKSLQIYEESLHHPNENDFKQFREFVFQNL